MNNIILMRSILYLLVFISIKLYSQDLNSDSLIIKRKLFQNQISRLNDSIKVIDSIMVLNSSKRLSNFSNLPYIRTTALEGAKLRKNPTPFSEVVMTINANSEIKVYDFYSNYLGVCVDSVCGYLNDIWVNVNDSLKKYIEVKQEIQRTKLRYQDELERLKIEQDKVTYEKQLLSKYGRTIYEKLKFGVYWIGMTDDMAIVSLGYPDNINRTVGKWGVHEQWVYSKRRVYLYFENDVLTSFQE